MLKQRVLTAIILLAVLLAALFARWHWPFMALTLLMIGAAGWEWARMNSASMTQAGSLGALLALACGGAWQMGWVGVGTGSRGIFWVACVVWVVGGLFALRAGPAKWPAVPRVVRWGLGLLVLWTAWLALASARVVGLNFLLSVCCLVWMADIAAYAGGRTFGRRKLAPSISPGKSWEGALSGALGVMLLAAVWIGIDKVWSLGSASVFTLLWQRYAPSILVLALIFLSAMSVVGDLVESLVKRAAGVKDSSALLPGHGGVLDRIDALLPVLPIAMALCSV